MPSVRISFANSASASLAVANSMRFRASKNSTTTPIKTRTSNSQTRPLQVNANSPKPLPLASALLADNPLRLSSGVDLIAPQICAAISRKPDIVDDAFGFGLLAAGAFEVVADPLLWPLPFALGGAGLRDGGAAGVVEVRALFVDCLSFSFELDLELLLTDLSFAELDSPCSCSVFSTMLCSARPSPWRSS